MTLKVCCTFATSMEAHEYARIAEELGYERAFLFDSPALCADVWVQLCRAAERTERIGLGPGVMVPSLRHPLVTASAISTLVSIAGEDRVMVGMGTGFTARYAMGQRPVSWAYMDRYVRALRALLKGDAVEWDGKMIQMLHPAGFAPRRPIDVPIVLGAVGPKGLAVAREVSDGIITLYNPVPGWDWCMNQVAGTVLEEGEDPGSQRVLEAAGATAGMGFHGSVEWGFDYPNAEEWRKAYEVVPEHVRHLALHTGHLIEINEHDRPFVTGELILAVGAAQTASQWRDRLAALEEAGATEVAYQPQGDIAHELEAFMEVAQSAGHQISTPLTVQR